MKVPNQSVRTNNVESEVDDIGQSDLQRFMEGRDSDKILKEIIEKAFEKAYAEKPASHLHEEARQMVAEQFLKKGKEFVVESLAKAIAYYVWYQIKTVFKMEKKERQRLEQYMKDNSQKPQDPHDIAAANDIVNVITANFPEYISYVMDKKDKTSNAKNSPASSKRRQRMRKQRKKLEKMLQGKGIEY